MSTILLIDDSDTLRAQLNKILSGQGYKVLEAENGKIGLEKINANKDTIKLILCDVNMPIMDGLKMCNEVASNPSINKIPIFMLTTESSLDVREQGKKAGVKAWINKPFEEEKLMPVIKKIIG